MSSIMLMLIHNVNISVTCTLHVQVLCNNLTQYWHTGQNLQLQSATLLIMLDNMCATWCLQIRNEKQKDVLQ